MKIMFFYETTHGIPRELFIKLWNESIEKGYLKNLLDLHRFSGNFCQRNKKYCRKNRILLSYDEIQKEEL